MESGSWGCASVLLRVEEEWAALRVEEGDRDAAAAAAAAAALCDFNMLARKLMMIYSSSSGGSSSSSSGSSSSSSSSSSGSGSSVGGADVGIYCVEDVLQRPLIHLVCSSSSSSTGALSTNCLRLLCAFYGLGSTCEEAAARAAAAGLLAVDAAGRGTCNASHATSIFTLSFPLAPSGCAHAAAAAGNAGSLPPSSLLPPPSSLSYFSFIFFTFSFVHYCSIFIYFPSSFAPPPPPPPPPPPAISTPHLAVDRTRH